MFVFQSEELIPKQYTDSYFQFNKDSRQSTYSFAFIFGGTTISWRSVKQSCIVDFTIEVEYVAAS